MNVRTRWTGSLLLAAGLAAVPVAAVAQQPAALPSASQVIARYVEAIGGRDAVMRHPTSRSVGTFEMPAAGLRGEMEILTAQPNRMVSVVNIPGLGTMRSGFDGTVGWSVDPIMGARLFSGAELESIRDQSTSLAALRDASLFQ
jgi:hypothetical protein